MLFLSSWLLLQIYGAVLGRQLHEVARKHRA